MAWLSGFSYRQKFTLKRTEGAVTNYQRKLVIYKGSGTSSGNEAYLNNHSQNWPYDIRITKSDQETLLNYWRETYDDTKQEIWIKFDSIGTTDTEFYIYYGNSSAGDVSNGDNTFEFFDDFDDNSLDTTKWTIKTGTFSEQNQRLEFTTSENTWSVIRSNTQFTDCRIVAKVYAYADTSWGDYRIIVRYGDNLDTSNRPYPCYPFLYRIGNTGNSASDGIYKTASTSGALTALATGTAGQPVRASAQWYKLETKIIGNNLEMLIDGNSLLSASDSTYTSSDYIGLASPSNKLYVDYFFTTKIVSPEPIWGTWYTEETTGYTLTADYGTFTLTGQIINFLRHLKLTAQQGAFTLQGMATALKKKLKLIADYGNYLFQGFAAALLYGYGVLAETGYYVLTGFSVTLKKISKLVAQYGSFILTGFSATLKRIFTLITQYGSFTLTGISSELKKISKLIAQTGTFTLTGFATQFITLIREKIFGGIKHFKIFGKIKGQKPFGHSK